MNFSPSSGMLEVPKLVVAATVMLVLAGRFGEAQEAHNMREERAREDAYKSGVIFGR